MEAIDEAISKLQELIQCSNLDEYWKIIRKFEDFAGITEKIDVNPEGKQSIDQLIKETRDLGGKVDKLRLHSRFPEGIALDECTEKRGVILPTSKLAGETTAQRNKETIMRMITGDAGKIGVYGMGGIGKTTVMRHINNDFLKEENKKFNCVIWVTVSKESSVFELQGAISRKLDLNLSSDGDRETRAGRILEALKTRGRYLIILDDLWEEYPLGEVGIPEPDSSNGCKLVLTTRSLDVCQRMECEAIKMDLLSKDEAWSLFLHHVGHDVLRVKDLEPVVRAVASECAGLPLAVATVGNSMRGKKEASEWRVALRELEEFSQQSYYKGEKVIQQLKFSYERLENDTLKISLLYCALYPEDYEIEREQLVELLALEGIIEENNSKRDEIDEGNVILNKLISNSLLERVTIYGNVPCVKMHDTVRDMVLHIDHLHSKYLAVSSIESKKKSHAMSKELLKIHISNCYSLNVSLMSPRFSTFFLRDYCLRNLPFQHFQASRVLNLPGFHFLQVLMNLISNLLNHIGLFLRGSSEFRYVPTLARLKNQLCLNLSVDELNLISPMCPKLTTFILRDQSLTSIPESFFRHFQALKILNLSCCYSLEELPDSISYLVNLVGLLLRGCSRLRNVPSLARLKNLRTLDLSLEEHKNNLLASAEMSHLNNIPKGLEELSNLRYLNLLLSSVRAIPIGVIRPHTDLRYLVCSPFTKVSANELRDLKKLEIFKGAFKGTHDLRAFVLHIEQEGLQLTSYTFVVGSTPQHLRLYNESYRGNYFDKVVRLVRCSLGAENDEYLLPEDVEMVEIEGVPDLTSLCTVVSLNSAKNLQVCEVKNCSGVIDLVSTSPSSSFVLQNLQRLKVGALDKLETLFGAEKAPNNVFPCLQELEIYGCAKIKVLFNIGFLSNLNNLEKIIISDCPELLDIVGESLNDGKDLEMETETRTIFPQLRSLELIWCPRLRSICPASRLWVCESLQLIKAKKCPKLEQLSLFYTPGDKAGQPSPPASLQRIELKRKLKDNPRKLHWVRQEI